MAAILAEYRPQFVLWTSFLAQVPLQIFFTVWAGLMMAGLAGNFLPNERDPGGTAWIAGVVVFLGFPVFVLCAKRLNYAHTTYRVFRDRIEIEEGFLTQRRKDIHLSSLREINLRRGILQRSVGLGSVYVATTATGQGQWWQASALLGATSTFGSGAMMMDLPNFEVAYQQLRSLVDERGPAAS